MGVWVTLGGAGGGLYTRGVHLKICKSTTCDHQVRFFKSKIIGKFTDVQLQEGYFNFILEKNL